MTGDLATETIERSKISHLPVRLAVEIQVRRKGGEKNRQATTGSNPWPVRHRAGSRDSPSLFLLFVLRNREPVTSIPRSGWIASRTRRRSQPPTDKTTTFQPRPRPFCRLLVQSLLEQTTKCCQEEENRVSFLSLHHRDGIFRTKYNFIGSNSFLVK